MKPTQIEQLTAVADLLMGAAHADGRLAGCELTTVHDILAALVEEHEALSLLHAHLEDFDPDTLDVEAICKRLPVTSAEACKSLLSLVSRVTDADGVHDLAEGSYIRRVADALGVAPDDCHDLAAEIVSVRSLTEPPPMPGRP